MSTHILYKHYYDVHFVNEEALKRLCNLHRVTQQVTDDDPNLGSLTAVPLWPQRFWCLHF